jgi:NAD(P)-dependent dehydrogenase (short-subunit alcohol dehydrogenase family)
MKKRGIEMNTQSNKVVMITGASKGLGRALAFAFAKEGATLAICARNKTGLLQVKSELEEIGAKVIAVVADVSLAKDIDRFVSVTEEAFGKVDILINNASVFGPGPTLLADYPEEHFLEVLRINVMNPFLMTKRVLPGMLIREEGSIINVTSEAGQTGFAEWGSYGISKFAVEGLTETWADELEGSGVRINMVDPGEMNTDMHQTAVPDCDYKLSDPNDLVEVFLYLASNESKNIQGQRLKAASFGKEEIE